MIEIYTGLPGSGKTLYMADQALVLLNKNKNWYKKSGKKVMLYSNMKLMPHIEKEYNEFIEYWHDPEQLTQIKDADVLWDEIAAHIDSTQWQNMPLDLKKWLQQHRKNGIAIYGTTQEFLMTDISLRRLVNSVYEMIKVIGSRDPSKTRPPVKRVWGIILKRKIDPLSYDDEGKRKYIGTSLIFIRKKFVNSFDTTQIIGGNKYPPLKHIERRCITPGCEHIKIVHA